MGLLPICVTNTMYQKSSLIAVLLVATASATPYGSPEVQGSESEKLVKPLHHTGSVQCGVEYVVVWDTEYREEPFQTCDTVYEQICQVESERLCQNTTREECQLVQDQVCNTEYKKVCRDEYKTVLEPYTETECVTHYKDDCEYHREIVGSGKVWAVVPGSCKKNPYDECHDVQKTHSKQVAYQVCDSVPEKKCHYVNRQECYLVPDQVCKSEPITKCSEVPKQICHVKHKRVPVRVSKTVPKKTCNVPDHYPPTHHTNTINEFVPPHVPAAVVPAPVPVTPVAPTATSTLDDILNRENTDNTFDRFVFEEENANNNATNTDNVKFSD